MAKAEKERFKVTNVIGKGSEKLVEEDGDERRKA